MNPYVNQIIEKVKKRHSGEPEFIQCVEEVLRSLEVAVEKNPEYEKADLLGRIVEPERLISFRVVWTDDGGVTHTNTGYRCQFNGAIGPFKGRLRFHPSVYPGIIKFWALSRPSKTA